jgi:hypothetical protein
MRKIYVEFHPLKDGPATRIKTTKKQRKKPTKALPTMFMYLSLNPKEEEYAIRHTVNNKAKGIGKSTRIR